MTPVAGKDAGKECKDKEATKQSREVGAARGGVTDEKGEGGEDGSVGSPQTDGVWRGGVGGSPPVAQSHPQKRTCKSYTEAEIERGLVATALASGNTRLAAATLAGEGLPIPRTTLRSWVTEIHPQRYEEVQASELPKLKKRLAEKHLALAERQMGVEHKLTDRLQESLEEIPARDLPGAIRNVGVDSAVHTDKGRDLLGDSANVNPHGKSFEELLRELATVAPWLVKRAETVDGESWEIEIPEDLVEEKT